MADERREHEYDVAIQTICYLTQSFNGTFKPNNANPIRKARTELLLQNQKVDDRGKEALALLGAGLRLFCVGK